MKKNLISLFVIIFCCIAYSARVEAQSSKLAVSNIFNLPDTIYEGVAYSNILVVVSNVDTIQSYQGSISVNMLTDSLNFPVQLSPGSSNVLLFPGDSIAFVVNNYFFDPSAFKEGDNIVVVWPIANVGDVDSLYTDVYYLHLAGIDKQHVTDEILIHPNPATDKVEIYTTGNYILERVRIYDVYGKLIINEELKSTTVDVHHLAPGVYNLFIYHRKGFSIKKLLKQ